MNITPELCRAFDNLANAFAFAAKSVAEIAGITLDEITKSHTAFGSFNKLLHAKGGYFPSIENAPEAYDRDELVSVGGSFITKEMYYAELEILAIAYDTAQEARGDSRRAFRS